VLSYPGLDTLSLYASCLSCLAYVYACYDHSSVLDQEDPYLHVVNLKYLLWCVDLPKITSSVCFQPLPSLRCCSTELAGRLVLRLDLKAFTPNTTLL